MHARTVPNLELSCHTPDWESVVVSKLSLRGNRASKSVSLLQLSDALNNLTWFPPLVSRKVRKLGFTAPDGQGGRAFNELGVFAVRNLSVVVATDLGFSFVTLQGCCGAVETLVVSVD